MAQPGIHVDATNNGGGTPLHSAAAHARAEVAAALLDAGADAGARDEARDTPRDAATRRGYRSAEAAIDRGPTIGATRWARRPKPASAEAAKAAGRAAFGAGEWAAAIGAYTDALLLIAPDDDAVLRSNRSASHARLGQYSAALADADAAAALRPEWPKGHGRRGAALHGLGDLGAAEAAYTEGLRLDPESVALRQGLDDVIKARDAKRASG